MLMTCYDTRPDQVGRYWVPRPKKARQGVLDGRTDGLDGCISLGGTAWHGMHGLSCFYLLLFPVAMKWFEIPTLIWLCRLMRCSC